MARIVMALIDTFLKLMVERRAESLVLGLDRVPFLRKAGETIELSMPALREEMLRRISGEMGAGETRREGRFRGAGAIEFGYKVHPDGPEMRIEIHALEAWSEPLMEEDPLTRAVAGFTRVAHPTSALDAPPPSGPDAGLVDILDQALALNASDVFLSSGKPARVRRNGAISQLGSMEPDSRQILGLLPDERAREELARSGSVDFAVRWEFSGGPRRIRINLFRHLDGVAAALRPIRQQAPRLSELSLPEDLHRLVSFPHGLVLVTGAAGSGKSTTLAAWVDHLNRTCSKHIITIEDPIEFEHREIQCMIHQREVGNNVESFASGLCAALRESPDVILIGELRDLETISAALTAAETGHLVLGTLHSGSASAAVNRIVDVFPGHQQTHIRTQLALSLRAVVSQRLIPTRAGTLAPAVEKLIVTPAVANGIREGQEQFMRNAMLTGGEDGMVTLERSLARLVRERVIDQETALSHVPDPKALLNMLR